MGIVSNWGNLPTAVVQTMAREAPFNPETDVDLGVAYIAIFILLMNSVFFALGVHKVSEILGIAADWEMCGWDFTENRTIRNETFWQRWSRRLSRPRQFISRRREVSPAEPVPNANVGQGGLNHMESKTSPIQLEGHSTQTALGRMTSLTPSLSAMIDSTNRIPGTMPLEGGDLPESPFQSLSKSPTPQPFEGDEDAGSIRSDARPSSVASEKPATRPTLLMRAVVTIQHVPTATWSVIAGLLCSLIQPLKALLTTTENWTGSRMPNAPDGNPPLFFLLDTTAYIGALTVPLGLMLLGSSFARLQVSFDHSPGLTCSFHRAFAMRPSRQVLPWRYPKVRSVWFRG